MNKKKISASVAEVSERFACGHRCSEAVLAVYGKKFGLSPDQCMQIACAFGGGVGGAGETCGVVSAAVIVLGLKYGRADKGDAANRVKTDARVREFLARFKAAHKHLRCNDLVGFDRSTPEGHDLAAATGVFKKLCPELVKDAALLLEELLED